jgi:hypothetical protein
MRTRIDLNAEVLGTLRMLTRRIGLEPVVLQHPAPSRALLRSSRARRRMKEARARCPQLGNNLWTEVHPPGSKDPARFAGLGPTPPRGAPQNQRHLGCSRSSSPSRGGAGSGPYGGTACASRAGGRGGLVKGAQAPGSVGLSSRRIHELATEGV